MEQLTLFEKFEENLPYKPYCSDNLEQGLWIREKITAKTKKYIQANPPKMIHWLVFDCDYSAAEKLIDIKSLPYPNLMITNPLNGNSHLLYGLASPVCSSDNAKFKPLNYLASVEFSLRTSLEADQGYCGLIVKNPLHQHWNTYEFKQELWEIGELAEFLTLPKKLPKKALSVGLGRNCSLFEVGRKFAYRCCLEFRMSSTLSKFNNHIYDFLKGENSTFPEPLKDNEVKTIAKSISSWTWKNYTGRKPDQEWLEYVARTHTPEIQSERGKKGGIKSGQVRFEGSIEQQKPWEAMGISRATWYRRQANP